MKAVLIKLFPNFFDSLINSTFMFITITVYCLSWHLLHPIEEFEVFFTCILIFETTTISTSYRVIPHNKKCRSKYMQYFGRACIIPPSFRNSRKSLGETHRQLYTSRPYLKSARITRGLGDAFMISCSHSLLMEKTLLFW